jgi:hypothetical protein
MSPTVKDILRKAEAWPEEDQQELADLARLIEARRTGTFRLTEDERVAVREGMAAAARGDFAPDDEIEEFYRLHRSR